MDWFAGTIGILSRQSRSMVATLSFAATVALVLLVCGRQYVDWGLFVHLALFLHHSVPITLRILDLSRSSADHSEGDSTALDDVVAKFIAILASCSVVTLSLPLPSASPLTTLGVASASGGRSKHKQHTPSTPIKMNDLEDTLEASLLTDRKGDWGGGVVSNWMVLRNLVGLNVGHLPDTPCNAWLNEAVCTSILQVIAVPLTSTIHPDWIVPVHTSCWNENMRTLIVSLSFVLQCVRVSLTPSPCHRVAEGNESKKLENGDHISPPVSTATDEARCRFSSLSWTTHQLITRCPLTLRQTQLQRHSREGRDCS
ncbi:hypothetical protein BLNAU_12029 [Blattamonas nauphoetae]|uniref:Transmembrane protein n=1 Tax=Blattamonas nauphoetae TaxID=2049346 RepID=A0ABQ9XPC0_9EUKA|nr:hypothetical protein BLNAU_12029 [Blattamonas nauphoetae]